MTQPSATSNASEPTHTDPNGPQPGNDAQDHTQHAASGTSGSSSTTISRRSESVSGPSDRIAYAVLAGLVALLIFIGVGFAQGWFGNLSAGGGNTTSTARTSPSDAAVYADFQKDCFEHSGNISDIGFGKKHCHAEAHWEVDN